jgi:hypothetical protein
MLEFIRCKLIGSNFIINLAREGFFSLYVAANLPEEVGEAACRRLGDQPVMRPSGQLKKRMRA